jgi:hypothetical protein
MIHVSRLCQRRDTGSDRSRVYGKLTNSKELLMKSEHIVMLLPKADLSKHLIKLDRKTGVFHP